MKPMARKILILRNSLGLIQRELGERLGVPQGTVSNWENGKQQPSSEHVVALAELAGVSVQDFLGMPTSGSLPASGRIVSVIGAVRAGAWVDQVEWPEGDRYSTMVTLADEFMTLPMHCLEVEGDSMNRYYPDGSRIFAVPLEAMPGGVKSGMIVVVVRKGMDGTYERTLKEFVVDSDGKKWLWPRSTSPEHQAPISYIKGGRTESVTIAAVVVYGMVRAPGMPSRYLR